jgi:hypothetical protein
VGDGVVDQVRHRVIELLDNHFVNQRISTFNQQFCLFAIFEGVVTDSARQAIGGLREGNHSGASQAFLELGGDLAEVARGLVALFDDEFNVGGGLSDSHNQLDHFL